MKQTAQDMALLIEEPDDLLDAELASMFPKGRTKIADSVLMQNKTGLCLVRKDDIARAEKRREDAIRYLMLGSCGFSIGCMAALIATRVIHPFVGLPAIGSAILILCALRVKKGHPQNWHF